MYTSSNGFGTVDVRISGVSFKRDWAIATLNNAVERAGYKYNRGVVNGFARVVTPYFIYKGGHAVHVQKKMTHITYTLYESLTANYSLMQAEFQNAAEFWQKHKDDEISIGEFMLGVVMAMKHEPYVTAKEARSTNMRPTGSKALDWFHGTVAPITVQEEDINFAQDIIEWAIEFYVGKLGYGEAIRAGLEYAYVNGYNANNMAYMYKDYMAFMHKNKTALVRSEIPVMLTLMKGDTSETMKDVHGNILEFEHPVEAKENELCIVRGVIYDVRDGGTHGFIDGKIVGRRLRSKEETVEADYRYS